MQIDCINLGDKIMTKYYVRKTTPNGNRITTDKYWLKKEKAQEFADEVNRCSFHARARVVSKE